MEKLFEEEIKELSEQSKIEDKDIIEAIYKHTFKELIDVMEKDKINYYKDLMKRQFRLVVAVAARCSDETVDCKMFLEWYFRLLKTDLITQCTMASINVQNYLDELDTLIEIFKDRLEKEKASASKPAQKHI